MPSSIVVISANTEGGIMELSAGEYFNNSIILSNVGGFDENPSAIGCPQ